MKEVIVVTTKPGLNEAEYAIVEDGQILRHGERIEIDLSALSSADQAALAGARAVLARLAQEDAVSKGLVPAE